MEDLIDTDFGKHDYDWLLSPPETFVAPFSKTSDHLTSSQKPKTKPTRSVSTTRASRVPSSQSEVTHSTKPIRSSSLTRPSVLKSNNFLTTNKNKNNSPSEKLHTSISSSRSSSTAAKSFNTIDPPRDQNPIKERPTSKPRNANSNSNLNSRSSTPSRKPPSNRATSTGRSAGALVHPIEILELPIEASKNSRSSSAGRVHSVKGSVGRTALNPLNAVSGIVHSKFVENLPQGKTQKTAVESGVRRISKAGAGFGRNISKNSADMAFRHMDMKQSIAVITNKMIIPPSIRSSYKQTERSVKENSRYNVISSSNLREDRKKDSDTYASAHCDAMLSKEDKNSLNWLHNAEDKSDQSVLFDHGDALPEPFELTDG